MKRIITDEAYGYTHSLEIERSEGEITIHSIADEDGLRTRRAPPIGFPVHQAAAVAYAIRCAENTPPRSYHQITNHPEAFDPFEPDALGALREAYAWIASPWVHTREAVTYRGANYDQLTDLLRRAIALEEVRRVRVRVPAERETV